MYLRLFRYNFLGNSNVTPMFHRCLILLQGKHLYHAEYSPDFKYDNS